ncbi:pseudouridine synthase [Mariniblastus sp.]|jgi:23S rRNA pseudouridine2605 synthase|nr:pseudouridine synthase [Mariniblastus sp.]MDB4756925.1 pseudouridine synthase [Mariniblastus sp.]
MLERLQKALAEGGIGSRRECEQLILNGRVEVDRKIVTKMGTKVDPAKQKIRVDGEIVKFGNKKYFAVNKPRGVLSTNNDPSGRMRVVDLIPTDQRIYTVGRLDKDSEGLIIVTNDGDLANKLTHPKYGIEKTYLIQVEGHPTREQMDALQAGIYLADGFAQIKLYQFKRKQKNTTEIEIVLDEGRNREVRRLLAKIGHKVLWLRRIGIGAFFLSNIPEGGNRQLSSEEIAALTQKPKRKLKKSPLKRTAAGKKPSTVKGKAPSRPRGQATKTAPGNKPVRKKSIRSKKSDRSKQEGTTPQTARKKSKRVFKKTTKRGAAAKTSATQKPGQEKTGRRKKNNSSKPAPAKVRKAKGTSSKKNVRQKKVVKPATRRKK